MATIRNQHYFIMDKRLKFFGTIASCLLDFNELTPAAPVATFMQELNEKKTLSVDQLAIALPNLSCYMSCLPYEQVTIWTPIFPACDQFLRRLWSLTGNQSKTGSEKDSGMSKSRLDGGGEGSIQLGSQMAPLFDIMCSVLRMPGVASHRSLLDAMAKLVSHGLQNSSCLTYHQVASICHLSNRAFSKDRDRLLVTRSAVLELVQALKFKTCLPDANFLLLTSLVLQDAGGSIQDDVAALGLGGSDPYGYGYNQADSHTIFLTGACEAMKNNMNDVLEFLADVHTLSKVKSNVKGLTIGLNEDTLGGILKASLAQYVSLEITKGNGRDTRSANKFLPWLFNPPSNTASQGPREFLDCVAHIRLLSWLLLGSVNHTLKYGVSESAVSQPIPLEASCHIADQVQVILAGFAEQSKTSVVHMCSLFHAFILCQLWTVYLEQTVATSSPKDEGQLLAGSILLDFWGKVTPGILQLVSHSKVLAEMVNLHFLSLMEALAECNSTILAKLMPLWCPVLFAYRTQIPDHVRVRLQSVQNYKPSDANNEDHLTTNSVLAKWLQRLQFKMGQIEMQASNVTQFFTV